MDEDISKLPFFTRVFFHIIKFVTRFSIPVLIVIFLLTAFFATRLVSLKIDADVNSFASGVEQNPYVDAYLAIIPGKTLARIYKQYQHALLEKNVRTFLQFKGKVNKEIRKTLQATTVGIAHGISINPLATALPLNGLLKSSATRRPINIFPATLKNVYMSVVATICEKCERDITSL